MAHAPLESARAIRPATSLLLLTGRLPAPPRLFLACGSLLNFKPAAAPLFTLRGLHRDLQHAVAEGSVGVLGVDTFGQRNLAVEAAVAALGAVVALLVLLALALAFAANHERFVRDFEVDVLFGQAGEVCAHDELAAALEDLDLRRPHASLRRA